MEQKTGTCPDFLFCFKKKSHAHVATFLLFYGKTGICLNFLRYLFFRFFAWFGGAVFVLFANDKRKEEE